MSKETKPVRRKISVREVKLSDQEEGFSFTGTLVGKVTKPFQTIDEKTGEILTKELSKVIFDTKEGRMAFVADKGLIGAMEDAMVKEGDQIEVVKLKKRNIGKGRTMNQYDIFAV